MFSFFLFLNNLYIKNRRKSNVKISNLRKKRILSQTIYVRLRICTKTIFFLTNATVLKIYKTYLLQIHLQKLLNKVNQLNLRK